MYVFYEKETLNLALHFKYTILNIYNQEISINLPT